MQSYFAIFSRSHFVAVLTGCRSDAMFSRWRHVTASRRAAINEEESGLSRRPAAAVTQRGRTERRAINNV